MNRSFILGHSYSRISTFQVSQITKLYNYTGIFYFIRHPASSMTIITHQGLIIAPTVVNHLTMQRNWLIYARG